MSELRYVCKRTNDCRCAECEVQWLNGEVAALRAENERLRDMIEIEREGQRSMARALAEINRLSRIDVAINLAEAPR